MERDGRSLDHKTLEELRMQAMERISDGETPSEVMAAYGFCRTTIYRWIRKANESSVGLDALRSTKGTGRPRTLTPAQEQRVFRWINGRDPRQYGMDFGLWTRQIVVRLIRDKLNISLSVTSVGSLLARLGLTPQKPLERAYQRDPEAIERWKQETYPGISRRAKAEDAEILFWDESGFRADTVHGKTWAKRGETPVIHRPGQRQSVGAASAVSASGAFWYCTYEGAMDAEMFVDFLKHLMRGRKKNVHLVLDGLPAHKKACVREYVESTKGKLSLHFLPGYAPELNPDELVWSHLKRTGVSRSPLKKGESLQGKVNDQLAKLRKSPRLVQSFFRAPEVAYISDR